jgi:hypothetical protein
MIGAVLGGLSAVASGLAAIKNFQSAQDAQKSANLYGQQFAGISEADKYKALKSRDISSLAAQRTAAQTAQATQAVQGMGPEGAAQVANIYQAGLQQDAQTAMDQAAMDAQMELKKAEGAQGVEARNIAAQRAFKTSQLEGAQTAASDLYNAGIAGVTGAISGLGTAAAGLATAEQFDFGLEAFKRQQLAKKGYNSEEIDQLLSAGLKG